MMEGGFAEIVTNLSQRIHDLETQEHKHYYTGVGSPNGVVAAPVGSLYISSAGGASTTLYVKESGGVTSSGWVAK